MTRTARSHAASPARPAPRRVKGVVAGGAAVLLLAGGGASFAGWSDQADIGGADFTSGKLTIAGDEDGGVWTDQRGAVVPAADLDAYLLVPGATLTYRESLDVVVDGANLAAAITTDFAGLTAGADDLTDALDVDLTIDGTPMAVDGTRATTALPVTTDTYDLVITVAFPWANPDDANGDWGTTAQGQHADLTAFDVTLTQKAMGTTVAAQG